MSSALSQNDLLTKWKRILSQMRSEVGNTAYESWLKKIELRSIDDNNILILACPHPDLEKLVRRHYISRIKELWKSENIGILDVNLIISSPNLPSNEVADTPISETDLANELQLDPKFTFNNFVVNSTNRVSFLAAQQMADFSSQFNPLYIHGGVGLGKTHLMHAIASHINKIYPKKKVLYFNADTFMKKIIQSIQNQEISFLKDEINNTDVLLIDDIQFISTSPKTKEEFLNSLNELINSGAQIIISSNVAPAFLENFDERIKSRLNGGMVTEIKRSDYELRCHILQSKAKMLNYDIEKDMIEYLANNINSNVRELEGALNRIVAHASLLGTDIDLGQVPQIIADLLQKSNRQISIDVIKKAVADYYEIPIKELNGVRRPKKIARARQIAIWLSKELTPYSLPEIGRKFDRDHTTVLHAIRRIDEIVASNDIESNEILNLKRHLST